MYHTELHVHKIFTCRCTYTSLLVKTHAHLFVVVFGGSNFPFAGWLSSLGGRKFGSICLFSLTSRWGVLGLSLLLVNDLHFLIPQHALISYYKVKENIQIHVCTKKIIPSGSLPIASTVAWYVFRLLHLTLHSENIFKLDTDGSTMFLADMTLIAPSSLNFTRK